MLISYHNRAALPQNDLVYLAFLFALHETVAEIELLPDLDFDDDEDMPAGFLDAVAFLRPVPLRVQVELLAETWSRHHARTEFEATLLDAAVVYAAFAVGSRVANDQPDLATAWLKHDHRIASPEIAHRAPEQLEELFDRWWDDRDFLMLEDMCDLPPDLAKSIRKEMEIPEEIVQPMFDALERGRVSVGVGEKLAGLLPTKEIQHIVPILTSLDRP